MCLLYRFLRNFLYFSLILQANGVKQRAVANLQSKQNLMTLKSLHELRMNVRTNKNMLFDYSKPAEKNKTLLEDNNKLVDYELAYGRPAERRLLEHDDIDQNFTNFQCRLCEPNTFCFQNHLSVCPAHSSSQSGSNEIVDCFCNAGYYQDAPFTAGGVCKSCEPNFYCKGLTKDVDGHLACPMHSISDAYSTSLQDCFCNKGYMPGARLDANFADYCVACSAGTYKASIGSQSCTACAANTFSNVSAATTCTLCPKNTLSLEQSDAIIDCVAKQGYYGLPGQEPIACDAGTYNDAINSTICHFCPVSTYVETTGSISVTDCQSCTQHSSIYDADGNEHDPAILPGVSKEQCKCDAGYTGDASTGVCVACEAGKSKSVEGAAACEICLVNTFAVEAAHVCTSCPANSTTLNLEARVSSLSCFCNAGYQPMQLIANEYQSIGIFSSIDLCAPCDPGYYKSSNDEHIACQACADGYFQQNHASSQCDTCVETTYTISEASVECTACGANEFSPEGSSSINSCVCLAGFSRFSGNVDDIAEEMNTDSDGDGDADCHVCKPGSYREFDTEDKYCIACSEGFVSAEASSYASSCVECAANFYVAMTQSGRFCRPCITNSFSSTGSVSINECFCNAGYAYTQDDNAVSFLLDVDDAALLESQTNCNACLAGTYKLHAGNDVCISCGAGKYATDPSRQLSESDYVNIGITEEASCQISPPNFYTVFNISTGVQDIVACPEHSTSAAGSKNLSACLCMPGFAFVSENKACVACPAGSFKTETADTQCTKCPQNTFQSYEGMISCVTCGNYSITVTNERVSAEECLCMSGYHAPYLSEHDKNNTPAQCVLCSPGSFTSVANLNRHCDTCGSSSFLSTKALIGIGLCLDCMASSTAVFSAFGSAGCVCNLGFIRVGSNIDANDITGISCQACNANFYCPNQYTQIACGAHSVSLQQSFSRTACKCNAGFFGVNGSCTKCPANHYCPFASVTPIACHANSTTEGLQGATNNSACICLPGMYDIAVATPDAAPECRVCDLDSFCFGDVLLKCPSNSSAPQKSSSLQQCVCDPGLTLSVSLQEIDGQLLSTPQCSTCASNVVCHGNNQYEFCAANATSYHSRCLCADGFYCDSAHDSLLPWSSCSKDAEIAYWVAQNANTAHSNVQLWTEINATKCTAAQDGQYAMNNQLFVCSEHETSLPASTSADDCRCKKGYYRNNAGMCEICPLDFVCPGGSFYDVEISIAGGLKEENEQESLRSVRDYDNKLITLQTGTFALTFAVCEAGYFRTSKYDTCKLCPMHYYCPPEEEMPTLPNVVACLQNEVTQFTGSYSRFDCQCDSGFKLSSTGATMACVPCAIGERCSAGVVVEQQCHYLNRVPNDDHTKCVCDIGHGEYQLACHICPAGSVKNFIGDVACDYCGPNEFAVNNTHCLPCPENSFSRPGASQCTCKNNYVMKDETCVLCPVNTYFVHDAWDGTNVLKPACLPCPVKNGIISTSEFSENRVIGPDACYCASGSLLHPRLPAGLHFANFSNATGINFALTCQACAANEYEKNGECLFCPPNTTSLKGSSDISQCTCMQISNLNQSTCYQPRVDYSCGGICEPELTPCVQCAEGKSKSEFSAIGNIDKCQVCAPSFYQEQTGSTACIQCPQYEKHLLFGSYNRTDCKCVAGYERRDNSCKACQHGTYKPTDVSDHLCTLCELGKFQHQSNATVCIECSYATSSLQLFAQSRLHETLGNQHTTHFHEHELLENLINNSIHPVLASNTTLALGSISVFQCQCEIGYEPVFDVSTIDDEFNPDKPKAAERCTPCRTGTFNPEIGLHMCDFCGTVLESYGSSYVHTYGNPAESAAYSVDHCLHCPPFSGQQSHLIGQENVAYDAQMIQNSIDTCMCFPGKQNFDAIAGCTNCSSYEIQPLFSRNPCQFCAAGYYFIRSDLECQICNVVDADGAENHVGFVINSVDESYLWADAESSCHCRLGYERLAKTSLCSQCTKGFYRNDNLTRVCAECSADQYQDLTGQLYCKACPANSYSYNATGLVDITQCVCAPGYEALNEVNKCELCAAGKYRTERTSNTELVNGVEQATTCILCPENFYCPEGSVNPIACPALEISDAGSTQLSDCLCPIGRGRKNENLQIYVPAAENACVLCPAGKFSNTRRNFACDACPINKNTSAVGATALLDCKCTPGHGISKNNILNGLQDEVDCDPCSNGFFSTGSRNIECIYCGFGSITTPPVAAFAPECCECDAEIGLKHRAN